MQNEVKSQLASSLSHIFNRPDPPEPWQNGGNLPWNEPEFAQRMLREHLDESHGAASRVTKERRMQIDWMWRRLGLQAGDKLYDITCGPGLYAVAFAERGCVVTGVDFSPASIAHARKLAAEHSVSANCVIIENDVRNEDQPPSSFDAAYFLYGQLAVFKREEASMLLRKIADSLKPGKHLCVELLDEAAVDKTAHNSWWFTDDKGLWSDRPFFHFGERYWLAEENLSVERYFIVDLQSGELQEINLCDQVYYAQEMTEMMLEAGFAEVEVVPAWGDLPLYDAQEWNVYVATK